MRIRKEREGEKRMKKAGIGKKSEMERKIEK